MESRPNDFFGSALRRGWDDWRRIQDFPKYMIRPNGEVRNSETGHMIRPIHTHGSPYVRLYKNGVVYSRGVKKLTKRAFPDVDPTEVLDEWVKIPDFEMYEINKYGRVRRVTTQRDIKIQTNSGEYVNLSKDGRTFRFAISSLLRLVGYRSE